MSDPFQHAPFWSAGSPATELLTGFVRGEPAMWARYVTGLDGIDVVSARLRIYDGRSTRPGALPLATAALTVLGEGGTPVVLIDLPGTLTALASDTTTFVASVTDALSVERIIASGRLLGCRSFEPAVAPEVVVPDVVPVQTLVTPTTLSTPSDGGVVQFSREVLPSGAPQDGVWSVDNLAAADIDQNGLLTKKGPGTVHVSFEPTGAASARGTATIVITAIVTLVADAVFIDNPTALLTANANTPQPFVRLVTDGNSLTDGVGSTPDAGGDPNGRRSTTSYPAQLAGLYLPDWPSLSWANLGITGQTWDDMEARGAATDAAFNASLVGYHVLMGWEVTNWLANRLQAGTPTTAQQIIDREKAWCLARKAAHPWVIGLIPTLPRIDSNLQPGTPAFDLFESLRVQSNTLRLQQFPQYADFVVDLDDALDAPGANNGPGASAYYAETVHLNSNGYALLARNVKTALDKWMSDRAGPVTTVVITPAGATDVIGGGGGASVVTVEITPSYAFDVLGGGGGGSAVVVVDVTPADPVDAV